KTASSSIGKGFFSKGTKKAIFFNLFVGIASFVMAASPLFVSVAQAGTFSFIDSLFAKVTPVTNAQGSTYNSQTMPLLAAAVNLDPNPAVGGGDISVVNGSALLPQEGPAGTAADITERSASSQISVYTVRS